jgi:hypothetical protein
MMKKEAIFVMDLRERDAVSGFDRSYIFEFDETIVNVRVWTALMALKSAGKFYFSNVGDSGYHDLVLDPRERRGTDDDFQDFFDMAMEHSNSFPQHGDSCKTISKCSWMVCLVEE